MIEKYYNIYREEESELNEQMTFKKALVFTLFDSFFIGVKVAIIIAFGWATINFYIISTLPKIALDICPLLK